jgi:hypothetical protein
MDVVSSLAGLRLEHCNSLQQQQQTLINMRAAPPVGHLTPSPPEVDDLDSGTASDDEVCHLECLDTDAVGSDIPIHLLSATQHNINTDRSHSMLRVPQSTQATMTSLYHVVTSSAAAKHPPDEADHLLPFDSSTLQPPSLHPSPGIFSPFNSFQTFGRLPGTAPGSIAICDDHFDWWWPAVTSLPPACDVTCSAFQRAAVSRDSRRCCTVNFCSSDSSSCNCSLSSSEPDPDRPSSEDDDEMDPTEAASTRLVLGTVRKRRRHNRDGNCLDVDEEIRNILDGSRQGVRCITRSSEEEETEEEPVAVMERVGGCLDCDPLSQGHVVPTVVDCVDTMSQQKRLRQSTASSEQRPSLNLYKMQKLRIGRKHHQHRSAAASSVRKMSLQLRPRPPPLSITSSDMQTPPYLSVCFQPTTAATCSRLPPYYFRSLTYIRSAVRPTTVISLTGSSLKSQ